MSTKTKEWKKGYLTLDVNPRVHHPAISESVRQANSECQYLHLEKVKDDEYIVTIIDSEDQQITFRLKAASEILCAVEFENEDVKHESHPFGEMIEKCPAE